MHNSNMNLSYKFFYRFFLNGFPLRLLHLLLLLLLLHLLLHDLLVRGPHHGAGRAHKPHTLLHTHLFSAHRGSHTCKEIVQNNLENDCFDFFLLLFKERHGKI